MPNERVNLKGEPQADGDLLRLELHQLRTVSATHLTAVIEDVDDTLADFLLSPGALLLWKSCSYETTLARIEPTRRDVRTRGSVTTYTEGRTLFLEAKCQEPVVRRHTSVINVQMNLDVDALVEEIKRRVETEEAFLGEC